MKKVSAFLKKTKGILAIGLVLVILGSFLASFVNTSGYTVKVSEIEFQADHGTLTGLLYMPDGAGADDQRPVIITTHGYLNSKEMQDAQAIEMSRRGYIVLDLDMYDHGDAKWAETYKVGEQFGTFWIYSQLDAVKYIYDQPYTKKDENGNAYIGVSGHSMGGFSTLIAIYMDEMNSLTAGYRMIYTGLSVGADYSYAAAVAPEDQFIAAFGDRTVGMIGAHYDEFFFNKSDEEKTETEKAVTGTVTYKDFVSTASGEQFLGLAAGTAGTQGKFYTVESGDLKYEDAVVRASQTGQHVIYTPNQIHPWNHFSIATTADAIDFYSQAFSGVTAATQTSADLSKSNQVWWLKELCNLIALIGFFMLIVPIATLLLSVPFLKKAKTDELPVVSVVQKGHRNVIFWCALIVSALIPAILFPTLMDKQASGMQVLSVISIVILCASIIVAIIGFIAARKKDEASVKFKNAGIGGAVMAVLSLAILLVVKKADMILALSHYFNEPTTNQVAYWAIISGLIIALITVGFYYFQKKNEGIKFADYGISSRISTIVASLIVALLTVGAVYLVLFAIQAIFGVDFRIWLFAVRTFKADRLVTALRYAPFFLVYFFINVAAINANTRGRKGGYAMAVLLNIGGLILWLLCQYGKDFVTGVALFPEQALNGILLLGLFPSLGIAAVFARKLFDKTNNVWLASFVNTLLFTMITVANTVMFWNIQ